MNPVELKLGVSNVKKINKGAVIIKCQSKNETEIQNKLPKFTVNSKYIVKYCSCFELL